MSGSKSAQKAAELVFANGQIPGETSKLHKHRESLEFQKNMPNFLQVMKDQALRRRGVTVEEDLGQAQKLHKFAEASLHDKRKNLDSYDDVRPSATGPRDLTDEQFEQEAMQRALDELKSKPGAAVPSASAGSSASAAAAVSLGGRPGTGPGPATKKARVTKASAEEEEDDSGDAKVATAPVAKAKKPVAKANALTLSFAVEDDGDE
jgi:hypothetical protein